MTETPAQESSRRDSPAHSSGVLAVCRRALQWVPANARLAVLTGSLVLAVMIAYVAWPGRASTLQIVCRHNFRAADLSVRVDGDLTFSEHLSGAAKKRFGVFAQVEGNFSKSLALASGEHLVEVQLKSVEDGFNQTKSSRVNLPPGEATTLQISTSRNAMSLAYQGPGVSSAEGSRFSDNAVSIFVTIIGSIASAGVGFFVQEFLKSKKPA